MTPTVLTALPFLLCLGLQYQAVPVECRKAQQEERLVEHLQNAGHDLVRPDGAAGGSSPVVVNVSLSLIRFLDVDVNRGYVELLCWMIFKWTDPRLAYQQLTQNTSVIRLDPSQIWTPDIELYNSDSSLLNGPHREHAIVSQNGHVFWLPKVILKVYCDGLGYAYSTTCSLRLGSWAYSGADLDVVGPPELDMTEFVPSGQWEITSPSANRTVNYYSCCPEPYPSIEYTFTLVQQ